MIGADKGGVGKTTVARSVLDYFSQNNVFARAFDTEFPHGTLKRFFPQQTKVVDITQTADQMRVVDTLGTSEAKITVIDTRAGALTTSLAALRDIGFLDAVKAEEFNFILFHILGPSISSLAEISETAPYVADANYFLVKNYVNDTTFFDWDPNTYNSYFNKVKSTGEVAIRKLNALAYEKVEVAGTPFMNFIENRTDNGAPADYSFVLRGYVRNWQNKNAEEFDRIRLLDIIAGRA